MNNIYPGADDDILEQLGANHIHKVCASFPDSRSDGFIVMCKCGASGYISNISVAFRHGKIEWQDSFDLLKI